MPSFGAARRLPANAALFADGSWRREEYAAASQQLLSREQEEHAVGAITSLVNLDAAVSARCVPRSCMQTLARV